MALQARLGIARLGASRLGAVRPIAVVEINGVDRSTLVDNLEIDLAINDEPDSARFRVEPTAGFTPALFQTVRIGIGGLAGGLTFAGQIQTCDHVRVRGSDKSWFEITCCDWIPLFDRRIITRTYVQQTITAIALDILSRDVDGFTGNGIQAGLPVVDEFVLERERPSVAFRRLATLIADGGGYVIRPNKDVRLFDSSGDLLHDAPTVPQSLTNTRWSLGRCRHRHTGSQLRNRVYATGRSTTVQISVPEGTDRYLLQTRGMPVVYAWIFNAAPGYILLEGQAWSYNGRRAALGPPVTILTAPVTAGATSVTVADNAPFLAVEASGSPLWFFAHGQYFGGAANVLDSTELFGIPSSGYGAITVDIPANTPVYHVDCLFGLNLYERASGLVPVQDPSGPSQVFLDREIAAGTDVVVLAIEDATAAQTALASLEGGDGIHEYPVDSQNDAPGAAYLAGAHLAAFADEDGIPEAEWDTLDLNAVPGLPQVFAFTGDDPLSLTLTITHASITFPNPKQLPKRVCRAANVKMARLADVLASVVSKV